MDEEAFRHGIRDRDPVTWTRLVELYDRPLRRLAHRLVGAGRDADNAAGDLWVKALSRARRYDPRLAPFPWLARICANLCWSQRQRALRFVQGDPDPIDRSRSGRDGGEDAGPALRRVLRSLPRREREVVTLRYLFEVSVDEIALLRGRSRKTVEKTLLRALRRLRATMDETGLSELKERA